MAQTAILFSGRDKRRDLSTIWLARAEQARWIASLLAADDAEILESYALECEAQAAGVSAPQQPIAA